MTTHASSWAVLAWWLGMSLVSLFNVILWIVVVERERRPEGRLQPTRWGQSVLAGLFALGCGFRSFLPRAEALRICLYDSWWSSAVMGRSVATVAELSFAVQWTVLVREWIEVAGTQLGRRLSRFYLPLIVTAELCSWHSTLTTNALGAVFEESLWTITCALVLVTLVALRLRARFVRWTLLMGVVYVLFMCFVDVPMYYQRWRDDQRAGRPYLTVREGWQDASHRWVVTRRWEDWREEMAWMSLYFSAGVWLSIAIIRAPFLDLRDGSTVPRPRSNR
jgi:hypothetical protein